jgi:hypothetical protein
MTTTIKPIKFVSLGDRFAEISVLLLTLVALAAGWLLKTNIENRSQAFTSGKISAQTPAGWLTFNPVGNEVLHVADRTAGGFGTTYLIEQQTVAADTQAGQITGMLTLERGNSLTGYRVLGQQEVLVQGHKASEIDYVYVESAANLSRAVMPAVVKAKDYVFVNGGQVVIVSYCADQSVFDMDLGRFYRFLVSVKF